MQPEVEIYIYILSGNAQASFKAQAKAQAKNSIKKAQANAQATRCSYLVSR